MKFNSRHLLFTTAMLLTQLGYSSEWTYREALSSGKSRVNVNSEQSIERSRVKISQSIDWDRAPKIKIDRVEFESAVREKRIEKTNELIGQLETLKKRNPSGRRLGEILMRLAEMYFDRSTDVALGESDEWEASVKRWEKKDSTQRGPRPVLKTPKADRHRRQSLALYLDLEKKSRDSRAAISESVRRDEVLFYLGMTFMDLRQQSKGIAPLRELLSQFPKSPRVLGARLQLADALFDARDHREALENYLMIIANNGKSKDLTDPMRAYTLYKMGWCYINLGTYEKAVLSFKKTIEISRDSKQSIGFKSEALNDLTRAFALAKQYDEGEEYFKDLGSDGELLLNSFYMNVADMAESRGDMARSQWALKKLASLNVAGDLRRSLALRELGMLQRAGKGQEYLASLEKFAEEFGASSSSHKKLSDDEKKANDEELVAILRSEAKAVHNRAQRVKKADAYMEAVPYYELYFKFVPKPNNDTAVNLHEMRFFFGELLYALKKFDAASDTYKEVGPGIHQTEADYARLLCLRDLARKSSSRADEFEGAVDEFRKNHADDPRGADLMYELAYQAYEEKNLQLAEKRLLVVLADYPDNDRSRDAVERLLFIWEQSGDFEDASKKAKALLNNPKYAQLLSSGIDRRRVNDFSSRAEFKDIEKLPDQSSGDKREKANAYFKLASGLEGELKEKALNNALVLADQSKDNELRLLVQQQFVREFPNSPYIADIYLKGGEIYALQGKFEAAMASYSRFLEIEIRKTKGQDRSAIEKARWNQILILGYLENVWTQNPDRPAPLSKKLLSDANAFVREHPKSKFRPQVISLLSERASLGTRDLRELNGLASLTSTEKQIIKFAEARMGVLSKDRNAITALLREISPAKSSDLSTGQRRIVALAALTKFQESRANYARMKLDYNPARFVSTLQKKFKAVEDLEREAVTVVSYGDGDVALRALTLISEDYGSLADALGKANIPTEELKTFVDPLKDKATGFLNSCFEKAKEYRISGSGLGTCQERLQSSATAKIWISELPMPEPVAVPDSISNDSSALLRSAWQGIRDRSFGQAELAMRLMKENDPTTYSSALGQNILGIVTWLHNNENAEALRLFRNALDDSSSSQKDLALTIRRNLAASFFQVADYERSVEFSKGLGASDPVGVQLEGLSYLLKGDYSRAEKFFSQVSQNFRKNREFLLYWAIAQGESGNTISAHRNLQDFLELTRPPRDHFSRKLFQVWGIKK